MNKPEALLMPTPVVGTSRPHESAHLHVSGAAPYTDDLPEPAGTLHAALGLSPIAHGKLTGIDLERVRRMPGVVAVLTAADIPAENNCGPLLHDDPILAADELRYVGQPVFAVIATERELARRAAALAKQVISAEPLPAVLTALEAHAAGQYVLPPMHLTRGEPAQHLANAPHRLQGTWSLGGQEQFYLEGQISLAVPQEGGEGLLVHCSTQHPSEMQQLVAHCLGWASHRVVVQCRRMGGGFGGKESQSALFACVASIAALKLGKPVKLRVDRDDDFLITGRRHGFDYRWDVGFDADGRILAADIELVSNAGHSADLSAPVMARALCHFDNAYWLPHVAMHGFCARTNTQSNTAFRGFGGPQGAIAIEMILDGVARRLGLDGTQVRQRNFYAPGRDITPYGQQVEELHAQALTARLLASSRYAERRAEIAAFNASSRVLKKGLAFTPVKFGISFNVAHLNQAGALVHVYTDGSVLVNHGGTEMGQGLNTKVAQVVAH
ncbi:MAG: molybdopterin cofactor-binding domain-containing protein, partial [Roseateles sp.]